MLRLEEIKYGSTDCKVIGIASLLGLSTAVEVSMRDVTRRWIGRLLDVIEKLFLVGDKTG